MMAKGSSRKVLVAALFALLGASAAWTQDTDHGDLLLQKMVSLVIAHNPLLVSQQRIVNEAQRIPDRAAGFTVPGMNVSAGLYTWNPYTGLFALLPSVTFGLSFSFADPSRELTILKVSEEKELAKQGWETARDTALATLFSKVRDILKLKSQGKNLQALRSYLHDYSVLADAQRTEQAISPDKLWDLRGRIADIDTQLDTLDGQLETTTMEVAMSLGGDAWQELLALLRELGA
jgi:hypothetical protein